MRPHGEPANIQATAYRAARGISKATRRELFFNALKRQEPLMMKNSFKLNEDSFAKFLEQVKNDPSILLLGQNYIARDGKNPLLSGLYKIPGLKEIDGQASFKDCWDKVIGEGAKNRAPESGLCEKLYSVMNEATLELPDQPRLRKIMKLGWNIVFTSAVDDVLSQKLGDNFGLSHIGAGETELRREYINPRRLHCAWLYGNLNPSEKIQAPINKKELGARKGKAAGKLAWIDQILNGYGVLAIDGWSPDDDWLEADSLVNNLSGLPPDSVWLFGDIELFKGHEGIQELAADGIVRLAGSTFEEALAKFGYLEEEEEEEFAGEGRIPVTIGAKGRERGRVALIPYDEYGALDSRIKLLSDDVELPPVINDYNRVKKFAHFLSQSGSPTWSFYHNDAGFYFERDKEKELLGMIASQIKLDGFSRRPILLAGPSNSGKTSLLAHIAMVLKKRHEFPVFFISGEPGDYRFGNSLKNMIKTYFMETHGHKARRNAIIIWDNASSLNDEERYIQLQRQLSECNPVIIGSCYSNDGAQAKGGANSFRLNLGSILSQGEKEKLEKVLGDISQDYLRKFQAISRRRTRKDNKKFNDYNLFYILEKIFEFEYGSEFQSVRKVLAEKFQLEAGIAEERANNQLDEFVKFYEEAEKSVIEKGFASAWQIKLEEWKKRNNMLSAEAHDSSAELERFEEMQAGIEKINSLLAVAGQFGAELPLDLILSFISQSNGSSGDIHNNKIKFILKTLEKDTLVQCQADESKSYFVRFRHPFEAQRYLSMHTPNMQKEDKSKYETDLLKEMIRATRFGSSSFHRKESQSMLKLIRRFGPNSEGRFEEEKFTPGNYKIYQDHLVSIADCIIDNAANDPEAILVAAHFLREAGEEKRNLDKAKGLLQKIIEEVDKESRQYIRAAVELCSNLVRGMELEYASATESLNIVNQVRNYLTEVYKKLVRAGASSGETNKLLDIWLNCFVNYKKAKNGEFKNTDEYHELLVETLLKITAWLEVTYDLDKYKFLKNIQNVYAELKKPDDRLKKRMREKNNDSYLYLEARGFWQRQEPGSDNPIEQDAFLAPDMPERYPDFQLSEEFRKRLVVAAERTVEFLGREENRHLVKNSADKQCLKMLLRSKWISATAKLPFEEDQLISFTRSQWQEFVNLAQICKETQSGYYLPALFIDAVYTWMFADIKEGKRKFRVMNDEFRWGWQKNPVILALPDNEKRLFKVRTYEDGEKRLLAQITDEISLSPGSDDYPSLKGKDGIYVSSAMLNYLYGNIQDKQPQQFSKPCTLNFNMSGPLLGIPGKNEQAYER